MAKAASDHGLPTYKLVFDAGSELHGATVPFLFRIDAAQINNATLAYIMKDWFLSFAIKHDPNALSFTDTPKPHWPQYLGGANHKADGVGDGGVGNLTELGKSDFNVMDVNYTMIGVTPDLDASARCDFFHAQSYAIRN